MATPDLQRLSRREREVLEIVYRLGQATATEVLAAMEDPPGLSSVRTVLLLLDKKDLLRHRRKGHHYIYSPTTPVGDIGEDVVEHVRDTFFKGSAKKMVSALLDVSDEQLAEDDLEEILNLIQERRAQGD